MSTKITTIMSQFDDGSTVPTVFNNVTEAKNWFYTADAQQCMNDNTTNVQFTLLADGNGQNTQLKKTEEWDMSGIGQIYQNQLISLIDADNWAANFHVTSSSTDHLF